MNSPLLKKCTIPQINKCFKIETVFLFLCKTKPRKFLVFYNRIFFEQKVLKSWIISPNHPKISTINLSHIYLINCFFGNLNPIRAGGAESARTFFNHQFIHENRGMEVPNFVTFPNLLRTFRKAKKKFLFFHRLIQPPPLRSQALSRSPALLGLIN